MAIKREFTTGQEFLNELNTKIGTNLTNEATPQMLLNSLKVLNEEVTYEITDDEVLELINNTTEDNKS